MCNIAVVSVHTSPLARPGTRDSGGMNVYIRELSRQLCRRAHTLDIFTRRTDPDSPQVTEIDGRTRVIQIDAGPPDAEKGSLQRYLPEFRCGVIRFHEEQDRSYDLVHSHYWLSGWVGQALKARWNVPHVIMFHTLGDAKHRSPLDEPFLLSVGRIEPLKGIDILSRAAAQTEGRFRLLVVGGDGKDAERKDGLRRLAEELGIGGDVIFQDAVSPRRRRLRRPLVLGELRAGCPGGDGLRRAGRRLPRRRASGDRAGRMHRLPGALALPGAVRRAVGVAPGERAA